MVGVAGSGKTTALEAVRRACEADGLRVLGTATSGQAARTVRRDAGIESYTVASLLARIDHGTARLDARTIVILDEAGMTDDQDLHRLLGETRKAGTKLVLVGDDRQLSAVGPGGSLGALVERFGGSVWPLSENVRQVDIGERQALAELRDGDVEVAVDWLAINGRIVTGADRPELIGAVVDGRCTRLPESATAEDRLAHGYAITVHRSQGATFDTVHDLEDGGGRELAYVGLSRARRCSTVYVGADFLDQAVDDLTKAWAIERRQEWVIDGHLTVAQGRSVQGQGSTSGDSLSVRVRRYTGGEQEPLMSTNDDHSHQPGQSLEENREKVLARGKPFPRYEEMVIEDLTDDEEERFLAAVAEA